MPATVVITEPFQGLAASFAQNLGAPGYAPLIVPHPVASKDERRLAALADSIVDAAVARLLPSADEQRT